MRRGKNYTQIRKKETTNNDQRTKAKALFREMGRRERRLDYQLKGEGERTFPGYVSYETNFEGDDYPEISPFYAFEDYEACYKAATHAAKALAEHNPKHDIRVRIVAYQLHKCFLEGSVTVKANGRIYRGPAE